MLRVWQCCGAEVFLWAAEFDNSKKNLTGSSQPVLWIWIRIRIRIILPDPDP